MQFRSQLVEPVLKSTRELFLNRVWQFFELFNFSKSLQTEPGLIRKPVLQIVRSLCFGNAVQKEVHHFWRPLGFNDSFLQKSEGHQSEENLLVFFEKASGNPLVNHNPYVLNEFLYPAFVLLLSHFDCFEIEEQKGLQGILVHVVHELQLYYKEEKH